MQAAKGAAVLFDAGQRSDPLLAGENGLLQRHGILAAEHLVFTLEKIPQISQETGFFSQHLGEMLAADIRIHGVGVHDLTQSASGSGSASGREPFGRSSGPEDPWARAFSIFMS